MQAHPTCIESASLIPEPQTPGYSCRDRCDFHHNPCQREVQYQMLLKRETLLHLRDNVALLVWPQLSHDCRG